MKKWTDEARKAQSEISKMQQWTDEKRKAHSVKMKKIVEANPDSYSKNNVSGRVKIYEVKSSTGLTKVKGRWELSVANWLNENNVRWTNDIKPYSYFWNNGWHLYFPDFYLIDSDILIEVKGYERERDRCKWGSVDKKLIIIKQKEIDNLDQNLRIREVVIPLGS